MGNLEQREGAWYFCGQEGATFWTVWNVLQKARKLSQVLRIGRQVVGKSQLGYSMFKYKMLESYELLRHRDKCGKQGPLTRHLEKVQFAKILTHSSTFTYVKLCSLTKRQTLEICSVD